MLSLNQARALIRRHVAELPPVHVLLNAALGRTLREEVRAGGDSPPFDCSAMDGFALGAPAARGKKGWRLVGSIAAGQTAGERLRAGQAVRVLTGAPVPPGAKRVVPQEDVEVSGDLVFPKKDRGETFIRKRGENVKSGALLLSTGTRLGEAEIAILAQAGVARPLVSPLARVVHLATGDELVGHDEVPGPGQIRDTNSPLVAAMVRRAGALVTHQELLVDHELAVEFELATLHSRHWDVLLISGGAGRGARDFARQSLESLGFTLRLGGVDLRPGRPLVFATREVAGGWQYAFVLPGNPVSHFATFHALVRLALERMSGAEPRWRVLHLPLGKKIAAQREARETLWPARIEWKPSGAVVVPLAWTSSGDLAALAGAEAFVRLPGASPERAKGEIVECVWLG